MMSSSIPANDGEDEHPASLPCFREIGFPAVAAALCCEKMPVPADERAEKHARESLSTDSWAEQPWFGVP